MSYNNANKNNIGCLSSNAVITAVIFFGGFLVYQCCSNCSGKDENDSNKTEHVTAPSPYYSAPYYPPVSPTYNEKSLKDSQSTVKSEIPERSSDPTTPLKETKISKYYEEGYEKGYDDGEDDAVMDNGWGGQFDDECKYTGKKKKDYQLGYEEGYEAGYYDNKESDE